MSLLECFVDRYTVYIASNLQIFPSIKCRCMCSIARCGIKSRFLFHENANSWHRNALTWGRDLESIGCWFDGNCTTHRCLSIVFMKTGCWSRPKHWMQRTAFQHCVIGQLECALVFFWLPFRCTSHLLRLLKLAIESYL